MVALPMIERVCPEQRDEANPQTDGHDAFEQLFGVSQESLRRDGVDPTAYSRENLPKALRDKDARARLGLPDPPPRHWWWVGPWDPRTPEWRHLVVYVLIGVALLLVAASVSDVAVRYPAILIGIASIARSQMLRRRVPFRAEFRRDGMPPDADQPAPR